MHAPVHTEVVTTDPEQGRAAVESAYASNRLRVRGSAEGFRFAQTRCDLGEVRLDTFHNTLTTEYTVAPLGQLIVTRVVEREMDVQTGGGHRRLGPGDVAVLARPDDKYATRLRGARLQLVGLDLGLIASVDDRGDALRRLALAPLDPAGARQWQRTVQYVTDTVRGETAAASPLVLGAVGRMLAATVLALFDPDRGREDAPATRAGSATVRRTIAYLDANPDLDLGVADVARAVGVSVRTLQMAFQRELGTTPMAYLRTVRLDRVRAELLAAGPGSGTTVTAVATRWGFHHSSRFAGQYREHFGELPRQTLARG
jgi:AraC-like DNA-binding protein